MTTKNTLEGTMKRDQEYISPDGRVWITAAKVADIWNDRSDKEYGKIGNYTRWSVFQRSKKLETLKTPLGNLYLEEEIRNVKLRPHPTRPDVSKQNRSRRKTDTKNT